MAQVYFELRDAIVHAVGESCRGERVGVLFSGGLDSTLVAHLAKPRAKEAVLFTAGVEGAPDVECAKRVAKELGMELELILLSGEEVVGLYDEAMKIYPDDFLKVELSVPVLVCCRRAKGKNLRVLLAGAGAEELFGGYQRHWEAYERGDDVREMLESELNALYSGDVARNSAVARSEGMELRCPLLDEEVVGLARQIPVSEKFAGERKGVLRAIARELGVPEEACARRKQALQYGSGVHKVLLKRFGRARKNI